MRGELAGDAAPPGARTDPYAVVVQDRDVVEFEYVQSRADLGQPPGAANRDVPDAAVGGSPSP
ncbi:hypothetical protein [Streptomyces shenzhenensis]|uniref:hypothetical protein n=1 Tax=Streptomyces shenzhenensis TaxID=943815 RepID=UPI0036B96D71